MPPRDTAPPPAPVPVGDTMTTLVLDSAIDAPRMVRVGTAHVLHLPPAMHAALDSAFPGYRSATRGEFGKDILRGVADQDSTAALFAAVGDFDGDGWLDVVMMGTCGLVSIFNEAGGARAQCVVTCDRNSPPSVYGRGEYIELEPQGKRPAAWWGGDKATEPERMVNAVAYHIYEKASVRYYFKDGNWRSVMTGD